jgi:3-dehydroquinate synthase
MDPVRLRVPSLLRPYPVLIGETLIGTIGELLDEQGISGPRFVVSNPLVWRLHGRSLLDRIPGSKTILIPDGEKHKQLVTVARIYDSLVRSEADRSSVLIALGGGVVGDTAGFAAATYLRGVALVHVPTTLVGQVDSAIGGKVGVNHALGKNLIGAFYPPSLVAIDPTLLDTLPRREFRAGLYEAVKYGLLASRELFVRIDRDLQALFARTRETLLPVIVECCRIKADLVERDERESGPRRALNLGHTAGHAIEAVTRYRRFRHGEAVAYGLLVAAELAVGRTLLDNGDRQALASLIAKMGPLPPVADLSAAEAIDAMRRDKKVIGGRLHYVLPGPVGVTTIVDDVTVREIEQALRSVGMRA